MKLNIYQVDTFAKRVFEGNPAAVCPLETWLDDGLLQRIAAENNLSETAFFVPSAKGFHLRWFTPAKEVDLCGHATLAAAHVLFNHLHDDRESIVFESKSGDLFVKKSRHGISMDFPADTPHPVEPPKALLAGLGLQPVKVLAARDYVVQLRNETEVRALKPDLSKWLKLDLRGVVITAKGDDVDFVSRAFFPKYGIDEDPVTGSAHCALAPFWADKLTINRLHAYQCSKRGGYVRCELNHGRVHLFGKAVDYMQGEITVE